MAIAIGQHTIASTNSAASLTTTGITTQASGSTFVALLSETAGFGAGTVSDSKSNTYVQKQTNVAVGGSGKANLWVCQNGTGGSGHTFTATPATSQGMVLAFIEITGAATASLDQNATAATGSSTTATTNSATTTSANELLLALFATGGLVTLSAPTNSFTLGDQTNTGGGNQATGGWSSNVVSSTGAYSSGVTLSASHGWAAMLLTFIQAATSAAPVTPTDLPAPTKKTSIFTDLVPNVLATTLALVAPFVQTDWQTPLRARPIQTDIAPNTLIAGIPQRMGFNVSDWVTPAKSRIAPLVDPVPNTLALGIPQPVGFNQYDWGVTPLKPRAIWFDDPPNVLATIPSAAAPFAQTDWITPARQRTAPQDAQQSGQTTRGIVPPPPLLPTELPTPRAPALQRFDDPPNLLLAALQPVALAPFAAADFGAAPRLRAALLVEPVPNALILGIPPVMGANQSDWPQPYRPRIAAQWGDAPNATIIQPAAAMFPFGLADWPTPRAAPTLWEIHFIWENSQLPTVPPSPVLLPSIDPLPIPLYTDWQGVSKEERAKIRRIEKKLKRLRGEYVELEQQQSQRGAPGEEPPIKAIERRAALNHEITALASALAGVARRSAERDDEEALLVQWDAHERAVAALLAEVAALLAKMTT